MSLRFLFLAAAVGFAALLSLWWQGAGPLLDATGAKGSARPDLPIDGPVVAFEESFDANGTPIERAAVGTAEDSGEAPTTDAILRLEFRSALDERPLQGVAFDVGSGKHRPVSPAPGEWRKSGSGDAEGIAELEVLSERPLWVRVWEGPVHGFAFAEIAAIAHGATETHVISVPAGVDLVWFGRVEASGEPIAGAQVTLYSFDESKEGENVRVPVVHSVTETDATGYVRVEGWTWKPMDVRVDVPGVGIGVAPVEEGHRVPADAQLISLWPVGGLRAVVRDGSGWALEGIEVEVAESTYALQPADGAQVTVREFRWRAETDESGIAVLSGLPAELPLDVRLMLSGQELFRRERAFSLDAGGTHVEQFVLGGAGTVSALVTDAKGTPLAGVVVWVVRNTYGEDTKRVLGPGDAQRRHAEQATDVSGRARFANVPHGHWYLGVVDPKQSDVALAEPFTLRADRANANIQITLEPGLAITGRVIDEAGDAVSGLRLSAVGESVGGHRATKTADDGSFRLAPLVDADHWLSLDLQGTKFIQEQPTTLSAGTENVEIELRIGGSIEGSVRDVSGKLVEGVQVRAFGFESDMPNSARGNQFSWDGKYKLEGLDDGLYALLATTNDGRIATLRGVRVNRAKTTQAPNLILAGAQRVRIRYEGQHESCDLLVTYEDATLSYVRHEPGTTETFLAPLGHLQVKATPKDGVSFHLEYPVVEGQKTEIVVRDPESD